MKILLANMYLNVLSILLWCSMANAYCQATNAINEIQLKSLLARFNDWPSHFPDSNAVPYGSWKQLVAVAKELQSRDLTSLTNSMHSLQGNGPMDSPKKYETDRKLFILLRVIFELPESIRESKSERSGGWVTFGSDVNTDGTINMAWPLKWNQGQPKLVCGCCGLEGRRFAAWSEYGYFRARFPMRDLSLFKGP